MKSLKIIFLLLIVVTGLFFSCSKNSEHQKSKMMSEDKFRSILTDIFVADAFLNKKNLNDSKLENIDSLSYYNFIFKKYGVSREEFYKTYRYYLDNIDELVKIQQSVVDSLTKRYHIVDSLQKIKFKTNNLWNLKPDWLLPDDGVTNSIPFRIVANRPGEYALMAKIKVFPDDLSGDLKMTLRVTYADSTTTEKFVRIFGRSGTEKDYFVKIRTNPYKQIKTISGEILDHSESTTYMHVSVRDIVLSYTEVDTTQSLDSIPEFPDSLDESGEPVY